MSVTLLMHVQMVDTCIGHFVTSPLKQCISRFVCKKNVTKVLGAIAQNLQDRIANGKQHFTIYIYQNDYTCGS